MLEFVGEEHLAPRSDGDVTPAAPAAPTCDEKGRDMWAEIEQGGEAGAGEWSVPAAREQFESKVRRWGDLAAALATFQQLGLHLEPALVCAALSKVCARERESESARERDRARASESGGGRDAAYSIHV
jgi:hypothetical protein